MSCFFNHPRRQQDLAGGEEQGPEHPRRPGEPDCSYYVKFGTCKFGMNCRFNHPLRNQYLPRGAYKCNHHDGGKTEVEEVKLNYLGFPLRPIIKVQLPVSAPMHLIWQGTGQCSYYMHMGTCKFGTNCKFHHPDPESSENAIDGSCQRNFYSVLDRGESNEQLVSFLAPSPPCRSLRIIPPHEVYSNPKRSGHQVEDSHFEPAEQVRYSRNQLLELREVVDVSKDILELKQRIDMELHDLVHNDLNVQTWSYNRYDLTGGEWRPQSAQTPAVGSQDKIWDRIHEPKESYASSGWQEQFYKHDKLHFEFDSKAQAKVDSQKFRFAPLENIRLPDVMFEDLLDSSSAAPEANLAVNTSIASKQGSCDASITNIIDKDVHKIPEEAKSRKSSIEEPNSTKPKKYYMNEEFNHPFDFGMNVSPSNSLAALRTDQVGCSIYEIMKFICRCWS